MTALERLRSLAATDPAVAPMAALQVLALEAAADPAWEHGSPDLETGRLADGVPLLHGTTLGVDPKRATQLLWRLAAAAAQHAGSSVEHGLGSETIALDLLEASMARDTARLGHVADQTGVDMGLLATLGMVATIPLLHACGRRAARLVAESRWDQGYCPVCGAWPTLAELRGLERQRRLRCGRCGADWPFRALVCVFCGCSDHKEMSYLAPEAERDSRRAETCACCHSYLKTLATLGPLQAAEILLQDTNSVELDIAAIQQGYARPERQGFALNVRVEAKSRGNGRFPWPR